MHMQQPEKYFDAKKFYKVRKILTDYVFIGITVYEQMDAKTTTHMDIHI